jgi:hypothetical protein
LSPGSEAHKDLNPPCAYDSNAQSHTNISGSPWPTRTVDTHTADPVTPLRRQEGTTTASRVNFPFLRSIRRPSDPWFDADCLAAKRATRRLECAYALASRRCRQAVDVSATSSGHHVAAEAAA